MKTPLNNINDLLACLEKIDRSRDKSLISLIAATGLYIDEIRTLSPQDINVSLSTIQTTGKRPRKLAILPFAKDYLNQWLSERPKSKHKALFISLTGNKAPLSQRGIDNIIRKWSDSINLKFNYQKLRTLSPLAPSHTPQADIFVPPSSSSSTNQQVISITRWIPIVSLCLALFYKGYKTLAK